MTESTSGDKNLSNVAGTSAISTKGKLRSFIGMGALAVGAVAYVFGSLIKSPQQIVVAPPRVVHQG